MTRWHDYPVDLEIGPKVHDLQGQIRYLEALDRILTKQGCTEKLMGKRVEWLESQFGELQVYREVDDGGITALISRFTTVLQKHNSWWNPGTPVEVLQMALEHVLQFLALRESLREMKIFVRFETIYPDDEEKTDETAGTES